MVLVAAIAVRRARRDDDQDAESLPGDRVQMPPSMSAEIVFLGLATLYSLHLPLRPPNPAGRAVLLSIFVWTGPLRRPAETPDLIGNLEWGASCTHRGAAPTTALRGVALIILACADTSGEPGDTAASWACQFCGAVVARCQRGPD